MKTWIESNDVLVLSKTYCPYCIETKNILKKEIQNYSKAKDGKNVTVKIVELDNLGGGRGKLLQAAGSRLGKVSSVPQIWIKTKAIGGNSDLKSKLAAKSFGDLLDA